MCTCSTSPKYQYNSTERCYLFKFSETDRDNSNLFWDSRIKCNGLVTCVYPDMFLKWRDITVCFCPDS